MATESPVGKLEDEVTCSICLEFFEDLVSIHCGHNFCQGCISQCWGESEPNVSCPQCRETAPQRNWKPNRELGRITEIAKQLSLRVGVGEEGRVCDLHGEDLKFFCEEDQKLIGLISSNRRARKSQPVGPTPEAAARNYKVPFLLSVLLLLLLLLLLKQNVRFERAIQTRMKALKKESTLLLESKLTEERKSKEALEFENEEERKKALNFSVAWWFGDGSWEKTDAERQKIVAEFEQLRQFLEEQERLLLARLEELDEEIVRRQNANGAKLSKDISFLNDLIHETEKCQPPTANFLQDFRSISDRWEKWKSQRPVEISSGMEKGIHIFMKKSTVLKKTLQKFKDTLSSELEQEWANVTLDPDTAHELLTLSADGKTVSGGGRHVWPHNPKRFNLIPCVLGCEGFISGRHFWEVEVGGGGNRWAVGVARESVRRQKWIRRDPEEGIWALSPHMNQDFAFTCPPTLSWGPRRIWVSLDYEGGQVAFFDANTGASIFTFPPTSFAGERIFPFFWVLGKESQLRLYP